MSPATTPAPRDRLRVAIQKSGRLGDPARALLSACGLSWRESRDRLFCFGESMPVDLLLVRDDDIPGLIADGVCDLGIVGRNLLAEVAAREEAERRRPAVVESRALGFGQCRLDIAVPLAFDWEGPRSLAGLRIATSYPGVLGRWLRQQGVEATVTVLSGSVEIAPRLGQADAVCDLVSSGATLAANQLRPVATLLDSEAVLAAPAVPLPGARAALADVLLRRLDGVLRLRDSRLLLFQAPRTAVPALMALLPDAEPPAVLQVDGADTLALQALCHGELDWPRLEALRSAGARGLMVLPVERTLA
jgi:ATP phosphoribosyltransferase